MTPHKALYGFPMNMVPGYTTRASTVAKVDAFLKIRDILNTELTFYLQRAQAKMKKQADSHRCDKEFSEGDWVLLKLQPYRQRTLAERSSQKLSKRFYRPFRIKKRVGKVAYRLELPETSAIHPVFHVSMLKKYHGMPPDLELPPLAELPFTFQPLSTDVVGRRIVEVPEGLRTEVLVDWDGLPRDESSWVDWETLVKMFPEVDLEGKVLLEGGIVVTTPNPSTVAASSPKETSPLSIAQEEQPIEEAREEQPAEGPIKGDPRPIRKSERVKRPSTWVRDFFLE